MGADPERHHLGADDCQQCAGEQRVNVPLATENRQPCEHDQLDRRADSGHHGSREYEQVVRRVDEQKPEMPPAIAETGELRLASSGVILDRELANHELLLGRADHHLGGELHPGRPEIQHRKHVPAQRPHSAMGVVNTGAKQEIEKARQQRVADIAVMPGHRAPVDVLHPVTDHHVGAGLELGQEPRYFRKVVGQVRVGHHDGAAAGGPQAGQIRRAIPAARLVDDACTRGCGKASAAILRAVVDDDDLADDLALVQGTHGSQDALGDRLGLIEARDQDGKAQRGARVESRCAARSRLLDCAHQQRRREAGVMAVITRARRKGRAARAAILAQNMETSAASMRICLVYDCLFPHTVGGAERWYRNLAERLAGEGHEVVYLTLRQWDRTVDPGVDGVTVVVAGPRMGLYAEAGRRRILPPLVFGAGVLWHLVRHGRRYDTVHTASFPYFSLLAAAIARPLGGYRLLVDWHEVWTPAYWREYLGRWGGRIGWAVQRTCVRLPHKAFCFSRLHARRLKDEGYRGAVTVLEGEYAGSLEPRPVIVPDPVAVFAGRFIPEKRPEALPPALARARAVVPELRGELFGDGPERARVAQAVAACGLNGWVSLRGFVSAEEVDRGLAHALCMVLPSKREGYGLVVVEAAAHGTPSVVVAEPDNAAVELIEEGINGFVAPSAAPDDLAAAIVRVHEGGEALRLSTANWFAANGRRLSLGHSLEVVARAYGEG